MVGQQLMYEMFLVTVSDFKYGLSYVIFVKYESSW